MKINTGRGTIPLITLVGIWSVSALTSLPGLAVSPILGQLTTIFPHATELDIQMLTSLPSLLIIPFVLLAGKLAEKRDFVRLLKAGLWMFAASGVLYLFSDKMWQLMVVSALLGIGSGLIIPLSTGLVSRYFTGEYRVKQFGYSSAITNADGMGFVFVAGDQMAASALHVRAQDMADPDHLQKLIHKYNIPMRKETVLCLDAHNPI